MTSEALLADLQALADDLAAKEAFWHHANPTAYQEGMRQAYDHAESLVRDLIAKHAPEPECHLVSDKETPDVSERDELARVIAHAYIDTGAQPALMADAILARGWRRR